MYVGILNNKIKFWFAKISKPMQASQMLRPTKPELFFEINSPYIDDIAAGVECVFIQTEELQG